MSRITCECGPKLHPHKGEHCGEPAIIVITLNDKRMIPVCGECEDWMYDSGHALATTERIVARGKARLERERVERRFHREEFVNEIAGRAGRLVRAEAIIRKLDAMIEAVKLRPTVACWADPETACPGCRSIIDLIESRKGYRLESEAKTIRTNGEEGRHGW